MADIRVEIKLLKLFTIINPPANFTGAKKGRYRFDSGHGIGKNVIRFSLPGNYPEVYFKTPICILDGCCAS